MSKEQKQFICNICNAVFLRAYNLKSHKTVHTTDKKFECDHVGCVKSFARQHDLTRHKKLHEKTFRHQCKGCGHHFSRLDALHRHYRNEAGKECVLKLGIDVPVGPRANQKKRTRDTKQESTSQADPNAYSQQDINVNPHPNDYLSTVHYSTASTRHLLGDTQPPFAQAQYPGNMAAMSMLMQQQQQRQRQQHHYHHPRQYPDDGQVDEDGNYAMMQDHHEFEQEQQEGAPSHGHELEHGNGNGQGQGQGQSQGVQAATNTNKSRKETRGRKSKRGGKVEKKSGRRNGSKTSPSTAVVPNEATDGSDHLAPPSSSYSPTNPSVSAFHIDQQHLQHQLHNPSSTIEEFFIQQQQNDMSYLNELQNALPPNVVDNVGGEHNTNQDNTNYESSSHVTEGSSGNKNSAKTTSKNGTDIQLMVDPELQL